MITFTKSIDGTPRATFRTEHRLSVGDLVELLAYAAVRGADVGAETTRADAEQAIRTVLWESGTECFERDWSDDPEADAARAAAVDVASRLWPARFAAEGA